jgi:hypothetical protein
MTDIDLEALETRRDALIDENILLREQLDKRDSFKTRKKMQDNQYELNTLWTVIIAANTMRKQQTIEEFQVMELIKERKNEIQELWKYTPQQNKAKPEFVCGHPNVTQDGFCQRGVSKEGQKCFNHREDW